MRFPTSSGGPSHARPAARLPRPAPALHEVVTARKPPFPSLPRPFDFPLPARTGGENASCPSRTARRRTAAREICLCTYLRPRIWRRPRMPAAWLSVVVVVVVVFHLVVPSLRRTPWTWRVFLRLREMNITSPRRRRRRIRATPCSRSTKCARCWPQRRRAQARRLP